MSKALATDVFEYVTPTVVDYARQIVNICELKRAAAQKKTGTISLAAAVYLRAWTLKVRPRVAVEIGTFIGTSTYAMCAPSIYTCDKDNDCVQSFSMDMAHDSGLSFSQSLQCYPFKTSTEMLAELVSKRIVADFFFFDGRIQVEDLPLIAQLSHRKTVYAFDDYEGGEKGVVNVRRLSPQLPNYELVPPPHEVPLCGKGRTTIAVMTP